MLSRRSILIRYYRRWGIWKPLKRPPDRVVATVNRGWLSSEKAEEIYGVIVILADNGIEYSVDVPATRRRRAELGEG